TCFSRDWSSDVCSSDLPAALHELADPGSAVHEAFETRRPVLVTDDVEGRVGNREAWIASGRPRSVLYQPLARHGVALGVLVVGRSEERRVGGEVGCGCG